MAGRAPYRRRLKRATLATALALALAAALLAVPASPAGAFTSLPNWMVRSTAINLINGYLGNSALTQAAFDDPSTLETSAPHSWLSQSVQTYDAYGPSTTPGSLLYALDNDKVPAGVTYLLYDDEAWNATPIAEQQDPALYMSLFVQAAHDYGYGAMLAPAVDLTTAMPCYKASAPDWANYLDDCDVPEIAAEAGPDVYELQSQRFEDDLSSGSDCDCFAWFVDQAAQQAADVDPFVAVYAGLASDHEGVISTPANLYEDTVATENDVSGYWLNVPQQSGACPSCTPGGAPQVAAGYLWLLGYQGNGSQTISFTPPAGAVVGGGAVLTATGGPSGNPVVYSVDPSSTPGACSLSGQNGADVSYAHAGDCVVDADQAGAAEWDAAAEVAVTIAIAPAPQSIQFTPPAAGTVGGTAVVSASGGLSGNPVVFSVDPSSGAGVCSLSGPDGATVSFGAAGSCVVDANQAGDADHLAAPQVTQTITVGPGAQAISLAPPPPAAAGTTASLGATGGSSGDPVVFSVDPTSGAGVCVLSGSEGATVTYTDAGTCVIDANEAGDADWNAAPQVSETISVAQGAESLQFPPAGTLQVGQLPTGTVGVTQTVSATPGPSSSPVVYSVDASSGAGVCSVSGVDGATVSFSAVGTCILDANQAGDANWLAAPQVSEMIAVGPGSQTIDFVPPATGSVGTSVQLSAGGGGSSSPVVFSVDPTSDAGACAVSGTDGSTLSFTGVGSCVVDADQAADANYAAAPQVTETVTVGQGSQTISFAPVTAALYGTSEALSAGGGASGDPVVFSVDPASGAGVCTLSGASTVSFTGVGSCLVDADQAGDANYSAAAQVTATISVGTATQVISLPGPPPAAAGLSATLGGDGGGSGNPVVFSLDPSSGAGVCSLSGPDGESVSFAAVGTCVVDANQTGDADYLPAPQISETIDVAPGTQSIAFGSPPAAKVGTSANVTATGGGSTSAVVFSVDASSGPGVCSASGATLTFSAVGQCVVDANQAADANYLAAPQVSEVLTVAPGAQTIAFSAPASGIVGTSTLLSASGGPSGNPVVFSVDPASGAGACRVSGVDGTTLTFAAVGSCVLDAEQGASGNWAAAPEVVATVGVGPGSQAISFTAPASGVFGTSVTLSATGGPSNSPVVFSVDPTSGPGVCNIAGGTTLELTGAGSCVVDANQVGDANWLAAPEVRISLAVVPAAQAITFTSTAPQGDFYQGPTYSVTATGGGSGDPVTFSSATPSVCAVAGSIVSFVGVGTCTIDANQAGNADWTAASQFGQSFNVVRAPQAIAFTSSTPAGATYGGAAYTVTATGGPSGRPVTIASATPSVCALSGASVSFVGVGTCTLDANQQGNSDYAPAPPATQSFPVAQATQVVTITSTAPAAAYYAGPTYSMTATGGGSGSPVTFTSERTSVCTVAGAVVAFVGVGTCAIDADQAGNADYSAAPESKQTFVVYKATQSFAITSKAPSKATDGGAKYTVTSTTGASKVPVVFTSATTSVCTVAGAVVSFVGVGTCTLDANEASNGDYYAAPQQVQSFRVVK